MPKDGSQELGALVVVDSLADSPLRGNWSHKFAMLVQHLAVHPLADLLLERQGRKQRVDQRLPIGEAVPASRLVHRQSAPLDVGHDLLDVGTLGQQRLDLGRVQLVVLARGHDLAVLAYNLAVLEVADGAIDRLVGNLVLDAVADLLAQRVVLLLHLAHGRRVGTGHPLDVGHGLARDLQHRVLNHLVPQFFEGGQGARRKLACGSVRVRELHVAKPHAALNRVGGRDHAGKDLLHVLGRQDQFAAKVLSVKLLQFGNDLAVGLSEPTSDAAEHAVKLNAGGLALGQPNLPAVGDVLVERLAFLGGHPGPGLQVLDALVRQQRLEVLDDGLAGVAAKSHVLHDVEVEMEHFMQDRVATTLASLDGCDQFLGVERVAPDVASRLATAACEQRQTAFDLLDQRVGDVEAKLVANFLKRERGQLLAAKLAQHLGQRFRQDGHARLVAVHDH